MYLRCSNNYSRTVLELFLDGIKKHMLPEYMIEKRGAERRSMITGNAAYTTSGLRGFGELCINL